MSFEPITLVIPFGASEPDAWAKLYGDRQGEPLTDLEQKIVDLTHSSEPMSNEVAAPAHRKVELTLHPDQVVVIISRQLADQYSDWTAITNVEAKVVNTNDPNVVDIQSRYM